jgi:PAS domain S-box-containing protein
MPLNKTIKSKLTWMMFAVSAFALLLSGIAYSTYEALTFKQGLIDKISSMARVTGNNTTAALTFYNRSDAELTLESLRADPIVLAASIYDNHGNVFATYARDGEQVALPPSPLRGQVVKEGRLDYYDDILLDGNKVGTILIRADMSALNDALKQNVTIIVAILIAALLAAYILSSMLQRFISEPITDLAETSRKVIEDEDFSVRAPATEGQDELSHLVRTFNAMLDAIAEREKALEKSSEALLETEERYTLAVSGANDGVWDWNIRTDTIYFSERWKTILGFQPDDDIGSRTNDWYRMIHQADLDKVRHALADHLEGTTPFFQQEHRMLSKDGEVLWVLNRGKSIKDNNGNVTRIAGTMTDITERRNHMLALRESEEQLRQSQKMEAIGRLAGGVAHDFNNLLTAIMSYNAMVLGNLNKDDPNVAYLKEITKASERAAALTNQLLVFSQKRVIEQKPINLNKVVNDMQKMFSRVIAADIEFRTECEEDLGIIKADPNQMEQVVLNLVVNACDAMENGGRLKITTRNVSLTKADTQGHADLRPGSYVLLEVTDTGHGMDKDVLSHVFEPFFTTKEMGKGTGLGLSTVYGIVNQSNGSIHVDSAPGKGTTFKIYLPRVADDMEEVEEQDDDNTEIPLGSATILLAEDEDRVRIALADSLRRAGYTVFEAKNGVEAMTIAEKQGEGIHVLVSDLIMPEMGGFELAEHMADLYPHIKTLFITGYMDDMKESETRLAPANAQYLNKPFTPRKLAEKINELL